MPGSIKLPPTVINTTGTTGTSPALQPSRPAGTAPAQAADRFASSKLQTQLTGRDAVRSPGQLASDLGNVNEVSELPERLAADLNIHLPELISLLNMTRDQKATRLMQFLVPYASRLAELAQANAVPIEQRGQVEQKLVAPMAEAGLEHVVELTTGKTGVEVAKELLRSETPQQAYAHLEAMKFDAPTWASRTDATKSNEVQRSNEPALQAQPPVIQPPREQRVSARAEVEDEPRKEKSTDKVLGKNMVWNVLHMFNGNDSGPMTEEKKKELLVATGWIIVMIVVVGTAVAFALLFT